MATYSVYNIKVDNGLYFNPGPTAGYVLGINSDGSTSWVQGGGGEGGSQTLEQTLALGNSVGTYSIVGSSNVSLVAGTYSSLPTAGTSGYSGVFNFANITQTSTDITAFNGTSGLGQSKSTLFMSGAGFAITSSDVGKSKALQVTSDNFVLQGLSASGFLKVDNLGFVSVDAGGGSGTSGTSGVSGTSGTSGVNGADGSSGTSGVSGTSGTSPAGGGGSSPIRLTNQTISINGWFATGSYYGYTFSDANIGTSSVVDFTPYNDSVFNVINAKIQPYIYSGSGYSIIYSAYPLSGTVSGDVLITTTI